jgi:hypothetical protein
MKRALLVASVIAGGVALAVSGIAAPPANAPPPAAAVPDAPTVTSLGSLMEKDLKWGMTSAQVIDVYNRLNGLFDKEYAPMLAKMQPGVAMQALEAERDNRKAQFERGFTRFLDTPTGWDTTPHKNEFTYKNDEAILPVQKDGKQRIFYFIKGKLWKIYDEIPLKADGVLGETYAAAVTKMNLVLGMPGRIRAANPAKSLDRTTTDWQDASTHLRLVDRSGEHLAGFVLESRDTLSNLDTLRTNKPADPFALDPSIAAITKKGVSDPNAANNASAADAGAPKKNR